VIRHIPEGKEMWSCFSEPPEKFVQLDLEYQKFGNKGIELQYYFNSLATNRGCSI